MISQAEADMRAARIMLDRCYAAECELPGVADAERCAVRAALGRIEAWLRRRALGGDKIAIRQVERELGRQVKLRGGR